MSVKMDRIVVGSRLWLTKQDFYDCVSNIIATTAAAKESAQFARAVVFASTADAKESAQFARTAVFATTAEAKYSAQFERAAVFASTAV